MFSQHTHWLIELALLEDIGSGDITSESTIAADALGAAVVIARENLVVCGLEAARLVFSKLDSNLVFEANLEEGTLAQPGTELFRISGKMRAILGGERTALNFLQRLSGIASTTAQIVDKVQSTKVKILDTRKTTPGWRELEKYAVRTGGGVNHRAGLFDAVLIKNNHIDALGGDVAKAVMAAREGTPAGTKIEVEVRDQSELEAALRSAPDAILMDNMSPSQLLDAVTVVRESEDGESIEIEASGGITAENIVDYANTGVDSISLGMLTHSVISRDISLRYLEPDA